MDPKQALEALMNSAARAYMTKAEHINAEHAFQVLSKLVATHVAEQQSAATEFKVAKEETL